MKPLLSLLIVAAVVSAGCVGGPGGTEPAAETNQNTSPTETRVTPPTETAETPSTVHSPTTPADGTIEWPEGPKDQPDRPETLTEQSVREYAKTHEYRYVYNTLWYSEYTEVTLDCSVETVGPAGEGYEVIVSCTGSSNTGGEAPGTRTATVMHADYFTQTYSYYVDENTTRRHQSD